MKYRINIVVDVPQPVDLEKVMQTIESNLSHKEIRILAYKILSERGNYGKESGS